MYDSETDANFVNVGVCIWQCASVQLMINVNRNEKATNSASAEH